VDTSWITARAKLTHPTQEVPFPSPNCSTIVSSQWPCSGAYCRSGVHFTDGLFTNKKRDNAKRWTVARRKSGTLTENVAVINSKSFILTFHMMDLLTSEYLLKEVQNFYSSPNIMMIKLRRIRWAMHVASIEAQRSIYKILTWNPEGKRTLGRLRRRCENNIKIDSKEAEWESVD
jgi:hypothetical protein